MCGSNNINWTKSVSSINWDGKIVLLAECWSGEIYNEKPKHLFLIELEDLPVVEVNKIKQKN